MNVENIRNEINELLLLIDSWEQVGAPTVIEQDIALAKVAKLYENIKFSAPQSLSVPIETSQSNVQINEPQESMVDNSAFAIDLDEVSFIEPEEEPERVSEIMPEPEIEVATEIEAEIEVEPEIEADPEIEAEPEIEVDPEIETEPEIEVTNEIETDPVIDSEIDPDPESPKSNDNMLFDLETIPKSRSRRSVLMSLYDDDKPKFKTEEEQKRERRVEINKSQPYQPQPQQIIEEPITAPTQEATPIEVEETIKVNNNSEIIGNVSEPVQTLADILAVEYETVAERLAVETPRIIYNDNAAYTSFDKLGINERYLFARDLFGDDPQLCIEELSTIGAFDNYDDAMIYIAENYNWNADSEGAKLLLAMLESKFNIS
ncbi:MAG: hypothetical protein SNG38_06220 [Rikenellaceae bacterium]